MSSYFIDDSAYLEHYGVLGMKWGVRKDRKRSSSSMKRMAKRDAKKVAKAKVDYGVGSGTKRKMLDRKVEQRSRISEDYKKAYKEAYAKQPHEKYAKKAEKRHMKDLKVANRNQQANKLLATGGAFLGWTVGAYAANMIKYLNHKTIILDKAGRSIRFDSSPGQESAMANIALYGSVAIGSLVGAKRYRDTQKARRKLNYKY